MQAIDFEYDGKYLSEYGFIICDFNFSSGANEVSAGSTITFNKVSRNSGKKYGLSSTQYDECITASFDICKDPDKFTLEEREISSDEFRAIMRWLNRREFLRFYAISDSVYSQNVCYYQASFNVSKITINERLYGIRLLMETDKPFGYGQEEEISLIFDGSNNSQVINNISDEIGTIFPTVVITCNASGDLTLYNDLEDCTTLIKGCQTGEVITINGDTQIITTTYNSHDICDAFNYEFFKIGNTIDNRENYISASLPCTVTIRYFPVIKNTP